MVVMVTVLLIKLLPLLRVRVKPELISGIICQKDGNMWRLFGNCGKKDKTIISFFN